LDFALHVEDKLDLDRLKSYGLPIMIDFGADYCPPCREMKPTLEKLNEELKGKVIIKYVDVEKLTKVAQDYPIRVIPTQVFYDKEGNPFNPSDPDAAGMYIYSHRETNEHLFTVHEGLMTETDILAVLREMGMEE
jgi:thioredoxin 1